MSKYLDSAGLSYFWGKIKAFVMGGATGSAAGSAGLVPAPAPGDEGKYLKGDGTWNAVAVPTKMSQLTNDSGFITNAGVTSFNGSTGAVTYTAPVTSVNGNTGAVTVAVPTKTSQLTNDSGFLTGIPFGHSTDAASTQAKTATVSGITALTTGLVICIGFDSYNSAVNPTLNINGLGAKPIWTAYQKVPGTTAEASWASGQTVLFRYDGTYWRQLTQPVQTAGGSSATAVEATLSASSWSNKTQSVTVSGVTSSSKVVVTPKYGSVDSYVAAEIYCTAQGTNSLTFTCATVPSAAVTVNVLIL